MRQNMSFEKGRYAAMNSWNRKSIFVQLELLFLILGGSGTIVSA